MTTFHCQDIDYDNLQRAGTNLGSIMSNNGNNKFELVYPSANGEVFISDSSQPGGTMWVATTVNSGFSFSTPNISVVADTSGTQSTGYFMVDFDNSTSSTVPLAMPKCNATYLSIQISNNGWSSDPSRFISGSIQFSVGYVPANTAVISSNFIAYAGSPHLTINFSDIDTVGERYRSFVTALNIDVALGDLVSVRAVTNLRISGGAAPTFGAYTTFIFFRGVV